jgi:hypothetical protein
MPSNLLMPCLRIPGSEMGGAGYVANAAMAPAISAVTGADSGLMGSIAALGSAFQYGQRVYAGGLAVCPGLGWCFNGQPFESHPALVG